MARAAAPDDAAGNNPPMSDWLLAGMCDPLQWRPEGAHAHGTSVEFHLQNAEGVIMFGDLGGFFESFLSIFQNLFDFLGPLLSLFGGIFPGS